MYQGRSGKEVRKETKSKNRREQAMYRKTHYHCYHVPFILMYCQDMVAVDRQRIRFFFTQFTHM